MNNFDETVDLEVDWDEIPIEEDAAISEDRSSQRTAVPYPTEGTPEGVSWHDLFTGIKQNRKGKIVNEPPRYVGPTEIEKLPQSPNRVLKTVNAMEWNVEFGAYTVHHPDVLLLSNSKATGASAGDVRTAAKDVEWIWITARHPETPLGFKAEWADRRFDSAIVQDPIGLPVENYFDYSYDKTLAKTMGYTVDSAARIAEARGAIYNDGSSRTVHQKLMTAAGEFNEWLDEWLRMLNPEAAPKPKPPRKPREEPIIDAGLGLLETGEWSAS